MVLESQACPAGQEVEAVIGQSGEQVVAPHPHVVPVQTNPAEHTQVLVAELQVAGEGQVQEVLPAGEGVAPVGQAAQVVVAPAADV